MKNHYSFIFYCMIAALVAFGCNGGSDTEGDADDDAADATPDGTDATPDTEPDVATDEEQDTAPDPAGDPTPDLAPDPTPDPTGETVEDTPEDAVEEELPAIVDDLGTNNQDITGVERVIFLGDSITAALYIPPPWSTRIQGDLRALWPGVEIHNYAVGGAKTDDVYNDQIGNIDTDSTKKTLIMMTIGGNDALQVMGEDSETSLAHMQEKFDNYLVPTIEFLTDAGNFPGGSFVILANVYDPTDGVGDFTHCGLGVFAEDWPEVDELAATLNSWYLDLCMEKGIDMLDTYMLFAGHGFNNDDPENEFYCNRCEPDCPCPRWYDLTCIHPNADGHTSLAGFFYEMITR